MVTEMSNWARGRWRVYLLLAFAIGIVAYGAPLHADSWRCTTQHSAGLLFPPDEMAWTPFLGSDANPAYVVRPPTSLDVHVIGPLTKALGLEDPPFVVVDADSAKLISFCISGFDVVEQLECSIGLRLNPMEMFVFSRSGLRFVRFSHGSFLFQDEILRKRAEGPGVSEQGLDLTASGSKGNSPLFFEAGKCEPL